MITANDIKLKGSERLTDNADGGGRMTGYEIVSGDINNLYTDISRTDRVAGRVSLRKSFLHVDTANTDMYLGAHSIITDPPDDPNISALLFSTKSHTDERAQARDRIESYVVRGVRAQWWLYDRQITGQRSLMLFAPLSAPLPEIGDVYNLVQNEGQESEYDQFVRVTSVASEVREFATGQGTLCGTYKRLVINIGISTPLRHTFDGAGMTCIDTLSPDAVVRLTQVADAAKYYGVTRPVQPIQHGDTVLHLDSVFGQIVPSTRGETPLADVQVGGVGGQDIASGPSTFRVYGPQHTGTIRIQINNRSYNYVINCQPIPAPGTLRVEYRALGKWYSLSDDGSGSLVGTSGGGGSVNFASGTAIVTLGALPDADTDLIYSWGSPAHFTDRSGAAAITPPRITGKLDTPAAPGTLVASFVSGGVTKIINESGGILSGAASGYLVAATGDYMIQFDGDLPDPNSQLQIDYDQVTTVTETLTGLAANSSGMVSFTLGQSPIAPGTLNFAWDTQQKQTASEAHWEVEVREYVYGGGGSSSYTPPTNGSGGIISAS